MRNLATETYSEFVTSNPMNIAKNSKFKHFFKTQWEYKKINESISNGKKISNYIWKPNFFASLLIT